MAGRPIAWLSILAIAGACAHEDGPDILASAQPWPEADRLFHSDKLGRFIHIRSDGFGASTIVLSDARQIEGPWSQPAVVYRPPESDRPDAFVYTAKGHPELTGADLVVTYATNTMADFSELVADTSIYYPRFVRLTLSPATLSSPSF